MSAEEKRNAGQDGEMPFLSKNEGVSSSLSLLGLGQTPIPQTSFHYVSDLGFRSKSFRHCTGADFSLRIRTSAVHVQLC
jgi:hypothetical protein